jgi:PAS domain S-box-containing protein
MDVTTRSLSVRQSCNAVADRSAESFDPLAKGEARHRFAVDAGEIGVWDWDVTSDEIWLSPMLFRLLGREPAEAPHAFEQFVAHVHSEDRAGVIAGAREAVSAKRPFNMEFRIVRPDGTEAWLVGRGNPIFGADGNVIRMLGVNLDITDRKLAEQRLIEMNATLEARVAEQIAEREELRLRVRETETRLEQVQRMETLGELASGVAHDFNNLLVPIFGVLDMLKRRPQGNDDIDALIRGASKAAGNAREMVRRLLTFSQRHHVEPEIVDIAHLINNMTDLLRHTLSQSIDFVVALEDDVPGVRINPTQLELSLLNLAINARDAMPGGGTLTLSAGRMAKNDKCVTLTIADTGVGMDAATLQRAPDPFFTTKPPGKGTGLGLFMARRLAEQAGGNLHIESVAGEGTAVAIHLPIAGQPPLSSTKPTLGLNISPADADSSD